MFPGNPTRVHPPPFPLPLFFPQHAAHESPFKNIRRRDRKRKPHNAASISSTGKVETASFTTRLVLVVLFGVSNGDVLEAFRNDITHGELVEQ